MKAQTTLWPALLSVVAATLILVSVISFGPALIGNLSPQPALAEELPPEATGVDLIQPTGTLHTLSIPTAAFSPLSDGMDYQNMGNALLVNAPNSHFVAPVYLPQGAQIKKLVAFAFDPTMSSDINVFLYKDAQNSSSGQTMAGFISTNSPVVQKLIDDTVVYPAVNNGQYSYHIQANLSGPGVTLYTIKIVYYY